MSKIGIKKKEDRIILRYINDDFEIFKGSITINDTFLILKCERKLDNLIYLIEKSNVLVTEHDDYVVIEIIGIPDFLYFLSKKPESSLLAQKIKDLEMKYDRKLRELEEEIKDIKRRNPLRRTGQIFIT